MYQVHIVGTILHNLLLQMRMRTSLADRQEVEPEASSFAKSAAQFSANLAGLSKVLNPNLKTHSGLE